MVRMAMLAMESPAVTVVTGTDRFMLLSPALAGH